MNMSTYIAEVKNWYGSSMEFLKGLHQEKKLGIYDAESVLSELIGVITQPAVCFSNLDDKDYENLCVLYASGLELAEEGMDTSENTFFNSVKKEYCVADILSLFSNIDKGAIGYKIEAAAYTYNIPIVANKVKYLILRDNPKTSDLFEHTDPNTFYTENIENSNIYDPLIKNALKSETYEQSIIDADILWNFYGCKAGNEERFFEIVKQNQAMREEKNGDFSKRLGSYLDRVSENGVNNDDVVECIKLFEEGASNKRQVLRDNKERIIEIQKEVAKVYMKNQRKFKGKQFIASAVIEIADKVNDILSNTDFKNPLVKRYPNLF